MMCGGAVPAFANPATTTLGVEDPGFWSRRYKFPGIYDIVSVSMESEKPRKTFSRLAKILLRHGGIRADPVQGSERDPKARVITTQWKVPQDEARDAVRELIGLGGLYGFSRWEYRKAWGEMAGDDPAELYVKRRVLDEDWQRILPVASTMPAIADLVAEQRGVVEDFVSLHEAARRFVWLSVLVADAQLSDPPWVPFASSAYTAPAPVSRTPRSVRYDLAHPPGFWRRATYEKACGIETQPFQVTLKSADPSRTVGRVAEVMKRADAQALKEACLPPVLLHSTTTDRSALRAMAYWIEMKRFELLRSALVERDSVDYRGRVRMALWPPVDSDAAEKEDMLRRELRESAQVLESAPAVRTLVQAELLRLEPAAEAYRSTQGKALVNIVVLPAL
ncbi:MAG: hypothetical protein A2X36_04065 [Elusimicrobia bacterium GWA2_69_24]|nr:MAG: hypothetical protein A2X36_04065 [Elusimicrobia bacterium GWA2_69_24]